MLDQDFETGLCWGTMGTIQQVIGVVYEGTDQPMFKVCAPEHSKLSQIISVFVKFAQDNPQRLHENYFFFTLEALRTAFPCPID